MSSVIPRLKGTNEVEVNNLEEGKRLIPEEDGFLCNYDRYPLASVGQFLFKDNVFYCGLLPGCIALKIIISGKRRRERLQQQRTRV